MARAPACMPTLTGHASSPASTRSIANGGSSKPAVISVVTPADERGRQQLRVDRVDVRVHGTRRRDQPVRHVRLGVGAHDEVDAVADRRAAGPPDAGDPAVLDADVGLDDADHGVDDERAREHDVELRRPGRTVPLRHAGAEVLRVAPDRLVAAGGAVLLRPGPRGPCRRGGRGRRSWRRSGGGTPRRRGGSSSATPPAVVRGSRRHRRPRSGPAGPSWSRPAPSPRTRRPRCRAGTRALPRGRTPGARSRGGTGSATRSGSRRRDVLVTSSSSVSRPSFTSMSARRRRSRAHPGPSGSGGRAAAQRVAQRDDPRAVAQQDLQADLGHQLPDAVHHLGRVHRGAAGRLDPARSRRPRGRPRASRRRRAPRPRAG